MNIKQKIKELPQVPGVYLMKDSLGNIIYVGKSKNLKSRVGQYFQSSKNHSPKVVKMVKNIKDFSYIETHTELEALLLECNLIKSLQPPYNRLMKNPKGYSYVKINIKEEFPALEIVNEIVDDGALYFGPFQSIGKIEKALEYLEEVFPIRRCSKLNTNGGSGCLNYHLGFCMGPCKGNASKEEYNSHIKEILSFFDGKGSYIEQELESKMKNAADELDFMKAAKYRDALAGIKHIGNKHKAEAASYRRKNLIAAEKISEDSFKLFYIKGNKLLYKETFHPSISDDEQWISNLMDKSILHFKIGNRNKSKTTKEELDEQQIIFSYINRSSNNIKYIKIPESYLKDKLNLKLYTAVKDFIKSMK